MEDKGSKSSLNMSLQHVEGAQELLEALRTKKPQEEIMRILLRHPRLMASFIITRDKYFSNMS